MAFPLDFPTFSHKFRSSAIRICFKLSSPNSTWKLWCHHCHSLQTSCRFGDERVRVLKPPKDISQIHLCDNVVPILHMLQDDLMVHPVLTCSNIFQHSILILSFHQNSKISEMERKCPDFQVDFALTWRWMVVPAPALPIKAGPIKGIAPGALVWGQRNWRLIGNFGKREMEYIYIYRHTYILISVQIYANQYAYIYIFFSVSIL